MRLFAAVLSSTLILILFIFLLLSFVSPLKNNLTGINSQDKPNTALYFSPSTENSSCYKKQSTDIYIDSQENTISSIQIELSFNPLDFSDFSIRSADDNFLGNSQSYQVALSEVRPEYGRASLSLELLPSQTARKGIGKVATISYTANPVGSNSAKISFLNKTTVMGQKNRMSLLKDTTPLSLFCF